MTNWTANRKPQVISALTEAGVNPKSAAGKAILKFEKAANTAYNAIRSGTSWDRIHYTGAYIRADEALQLLNGGGGILFDNTPKFWNEWKAYASVKGITHDCTMGDCLC